MFYLKNYPVVAYAQPVEFVLTYELLDVCRPARISGNFLHFLSDLSGDMCWKFQKLLGRDTRIFDAIHSKIVTYCYNYRKRKSTSCAHEGNMGEPPLEQPP